MQAIWLAELVPAAAPPAPAPALEDADDSGSDAEGGDAKADAKGKNGKAAKAKKPKAPPAPAPVYRFADAATQLHVVAAPAQALSVSDQSTLTAKAVTRNHIGWAQRSADEGNGGEWIAFVKRADGRLEELLPSLAAKVYAKVSVETAMAHRNLMPLPAAAKPKAAKAGKGKDKKDATKDAAKDADDAKAAKADGPAGVRLPYMPSSVYNEKKQAFELHKLLKRKAVQWWKMNRHFYVRRKNRMRPRNLFTMFMRLHAFDLPNTGAGAASLASHPMAYQWFSQIIARAEQELNGNAHLAKPNAKGKTPNANAKPNAAAAASDSTPAAAAAADADADADASDDDSDSAKAKAKKAPAPKPAAKAGTIRVLAAEESQHQRGRRL